jgi:hypothetical protein
MTSPGLKFRHVADPSGNRASIATDRSPYAGAKAVAFIFSSVGASEQCRLMGCYAVWLM